MALDLISIQNALRAWVVSVSGLEVIFANPNAPRPVIQYATIFVYQNTPVGVAEHKSDLLIDNTIDRSYSTVEEISVSINTFYANAYQNATLLKDSLARVTIREALYQSGLGYIRAGSIRDIPEIIDTLYEERAQFDCFFYARSLDTENIETIRQVELTNELNGYTTIIQKP